MKDLKTGDRVAWIMSGRIVGIGLLGEVTVKLDDGSEIVTDSDLILDNWVKASVKDVAVAKAAEYKTKLDMIKRLYGRLASYQRDDLIDGVLGINKEDSDNK